MSLATILLKTGAVSTAGTPAVAYAPANTAPKKAAIVKSMRFTNTGSGTTKLRAWFQKGGGTFDSATPKARRILPYDQALPAGYTLIDDAELTLDSGDGIYLQIDTGTVEFVFSGSERDLS